MSRLKHLLVLLSRLLALSFLVLAFARPYIPLSPQSRANAAGVVSVYVDNSFSMEGVSTQGPLLEVARRKATEIARSFPSSTRFQLLTNDFSSLQQRLLTRDDFMEELNRVKPVYTGRTLSEILVRQKEAVSQEGPVKASAFIISDFQRSMADFDKLKSDSLLDISLVALPLQAQNNLYIDTCWLESPVIQLNQSATLKVRVVNNGDEDAGSVPVSLMLAGVQKAVTAVPVAKRSKAELDFSFTPSAAGWQKGEVRLTDHPVTFDDSYYFSFEVKAVLKVLAIGSRQASPYLQALFEGNPLFAFEQTRVESVDYNSFSSRDLIILNQPVQIPSGLSEELKKYIDNGGTVCFFPDSTSDLSSCNSFLTLVGADPLLDVVEVSDRIAAIDKAHLLFRDVFENKNADADARIDLPAVSRMFAMGRGVNSSGQALLRTQSGLPVLSEYLSGKGLLFVFSVPLDPGFSNLARHALIVPALYRMSLLSGRTAFSAAWLGDNSAVVLKLAPPSGDQAFHVVNREMKTDVIPAFRVTPAGVSVQADAQLNAAGSYDLLKGRESVAVLSYNYNRKESDLRFLSEDQLQQALNTSGLSQVALYKASTPDLTKLITEITTGISLWKYCVIFCLLFLLLEIILIRFWKTT